ncbi:MAG: hypothetical protein CME32_11690 [Gimesia sp.]|nr:hypothetical protein [Gimesia sp.]
MLYQVIRPTNGHVIAKFEKSHDYYYRFPDGCEVPLQVQYAWCHGCELFVEAEKLFTTQEIQQKIENLSIKPEEWLQDIQNKMPEFAEWMQTQEIDGRPMLEVRVEERRQRCESWISALNWFVGRKSTARCLECGSMTAIKVLPWHKVIPHPYGEGVIELTFDATIVDGPLPTWTPPPIYFDLEGNRLITPDDKEVRS